MAEDDGFLKNYRQPPEEKGADTQNTGTAGTPPVTDTQTQATTEQTSGVQGTEQAQTTKPDEFFETFNKRFSSSFKADDEIKNVLGLQQKIGEYETKAKLADDYASKIEDYEKQLENFKNNDNSVFLEKPLIRKAFIADQLLAKYPDKDAYALQEIVMADVDKLSDLDVLTKEQKIDLPSLTEENIKEALLDKYGIDPTTPPTEWSSIAKTKMAIDAKSARANIKSLTNGIEFPKTATKEQREQEIAKAMQTRVQTAEPMKAKFVAFDKFKDGSFEFDVPAEFKSKLGESFDAMFIKGDMEPTEENFKLAEDMRNAQFVYQNLQKILEVAVKQGQTEVQKKLDGVLNNTRPPNTTTATDEGGVKSDLPGPGLSKFLEDNGR